MRAQLGKIIAQLEAMQERAEELSGSDREQTATKYDRVCDCLEEAIETLRDGVKELEQ